MGYLDVLIHPDALAYIQVRGGELVLFALGSPSCCGGNCAPYPAVEMGPPRLPPDHYRIFDHNGVLVHVDRHLVEHGRSIEIELRKTLWWSSLVAVYQTP